MKETFGQSVESSVNPDYCLKIELDDDDFYYVFIEYENSNRGMRSHACKYISWKINNKDIDFWILFVRSPTHMAKHTRDCIEAENCLIESRVKFRVMDYENSITLADEIDQCVEKGPVQVHDLDDKGNYYPVYDLDRYQL